MRLEEFVRMGAAAQAAVDEMLEKCRCGHTRAEHKGGFGCVGLEAAGKTRKRLCSCSRFHQLIDPEVRDALAATAERTAELEAARPKRARFVVVRFGKTGEQLAAVHPHYHDCGKGQAWTTVWMRTAKRWALSASMREILRDATADDFRIYQCDADAQREQLR